MKMILLIIVSTFFCNRAYSQKITKEQKINDSTVHIFGDDFEGVIFYKKSGNRNYPKTSDILIFERSIKTYLLNERSKSENIKFIHDNLRNYFRQYKVQTNNKGHVIIDVFCLRKKLKATDKSWLMGPVVVKDGGANYWGVNFNINTNKFNYLRINSRG